MKKLFLAMTAAVALAAPAQAADMPVKAPAPAVAAVHSWSGFYVGGHIGGHNLRTGGFDGSEPADAVTAFVFSLCGPLGGCPRVLGRESDWGVIGGGQVGYNWQSGAVVFGVEADVQASSARAVSRIFQSNAGVLASAWEAIGTTEIDYLVTVRGRVGTTAWANSLIYVTGGWAFARVEQQFSFQFFPPSSASAVGRGKDTVNGWTAGGGIEKRLSSNWSFGLEYLFVRLHDADNFVTGPAPVAPAGCLQGAIATCQFIVRTGDLDNHIIRAKLNWRWDGAPVVARY